MNLIFWKSYKKTNNEGAALILSLGILALITVLAVGYTTLMRFEEKASRNTVYFVQAEQIAQAALNYSVAVLLKDLADDEAGGASSMYDSYDEEWASTFSSTNSSDPDLDGSDFTNSNWTHSRWIYVHENSNGSGRIIGRFAVLIQDEAGKININTAGPAAQDEGWSPYEIDLQEIPGIGTTLDDAIVNYRQGGAGTPVPGADVTGPAPYFSDDNNNNSPFTDDGIDNDGDGSTDEMNEGITNDPTEFDPEFPYDDDRPFTSVEELMKISGIGANIVAAAKNYATVWSYDINKHWTGSWTKKININHLVTTAQLYSLNLHTTNEKYRMAANMIDYADRDNYPTFTTTDSSTPTSLNSYIGIEGLQVNEVMSDVGNIARQNDEDNPGTNNDVVRSGNWTFNSGGSTSDTGTDGQVADYTWPWDNGVYDITIAASTDGGVLGGMTYELEKAGGVPEAGYVTGTLNGPVTINNVQISGGAINLRLTAAADDPALLPNPGVSYFDFIDVKAGKYIEIINISKHDIAVNKNGAASWKLNIGGTLTPPAHDGLPCTITGGTDFELSAALNNTSSSVNLDGYTNGFPPTYDYLVITDSLYALDAIHRNDTGSWGDGGGEAGVLLSIPLSNASANFLTTLPAAGANLALVDANNRVLAYMPVANEYHITGYGASHGAGQSTQRVSPIDQTAAWVYKVNTPSISNDYNPSPDPNSNTGDNKYWGIKDRPYASIGEIGDSYTGTSSAGTYDIEAHGEDFLYQLTVSEKRLEAEDDDDTTHHGWSTESGHDGTTRYVAPNNNGTWTWSWTFNMASDINKPFRLRSNSSYDAFIAGEFGYNFESSGGTDFYARPDGSSSLSNVSISSGSVSVTIDGNGADTPKLDYVLLTPEPYTWGKININTASREVLKALPGINSGLAGNIISYRASNVFNQIEELADVSGMGEATFKPVSNLITVRSDIYRVVIKAERIVDVNGDGVEGDASDISASTVNLEAVVDRNPSQRFGGSDPYRIESSKLNYE